MLKISTNYREIKWIKKELLYIKYGVIILCKETIIKLIIDSEFYKKQAVTCVVSNNDEYYTYL